MADFVQLWVYLAATPLFGLTATLATYVAAQAFFDRVDRAPWANPVLWSVVGIGCVLVATSTPYPTYSISPARSLFMCCSGRPWWRWLGRCGCVAPKSASVASR